jgi:cytochrome c biogenesis protein ResB
VRKLLEALKSVKLALALIAYLILTGILASLVPQGREASFYYSTLPAFAAGLVLGSGFSRFYGSVLFLLPALIFFANLSACSADRFVRERGKSIDRRRHGPDILHLGLILLLVGAVLGQVAKQSRPSWEGFARLAAGEAVELPNGRLLTLLRLSSERYPDGRPKDWISEVEISQAGKVLIAEYKIRVNHPLRMGALSIYQASFGSERVLELMDPSGARRSLAAGEYVEDGEGSIMLMSVDLDSGTAIVREESAEGSRTISIRKGSRVGAFVVEGAGEAQLSGLQAFYDPAYPLVILAFAVIALGAFITFARRIGELEE